MSEATARAARREIRRAFGDQAIGVVDRHADAIQVLRDTVSELRRELHTHQVATLRGLEAGALAREPLRRPLVGRLRWLLTGR
jgi:hypothetical protein